MSDSWFTTEGSTGTLSIEYRDGDWFVASPDIADDIKCLFVSGMTVDDSVDQQKVEVTVSSYKIGVGSSTSLLLLSPPEESTPSSESATESEESGSSNEKYGTDTQTGEGVSETQGEKSGSTGDREPARGLASLTGSGEYVTVEATVDSIHWVKKSESGIPDIKGELTDDSVIEPIYFVVSEGVKHPYLEEGAEFRFEGVKDHYYTRKDQVQVVVTEYTDFERLDDGTGPSSPKQSSESTSREATSRSRPRSSSKRANLAKIANEKIGDEEFTTRQDDEDSMVGRAKKEAISQQRDPAIDPRLRESDDDDEKS